MLCSYFPKWERHFTYNSPFQASWGKKFQGMIHHDIFEIMLSNSSLALSPNIFTKCWADSWFRCTSFAFCLTVIRPCKFSAITVFFLVNDYFFIVLHEEGCWKNSMLVRGQKMNVGRNSLMWYADHSVKIGLYLFVRSYLNTVANEAAMGKSREIGYLIR